MTCPPQSLLLADGSVGRSSLVVVLAEDERQQRLIRRYLYRLGLGPHDIRAMPLPSGRGSGEKWVREQYASEVKNYRARSVHAKTALVVAIDADTGQVDRRLRHLREALAHAGLDPRANAEAITHLVPRRNVETWILCLSGRQVDEVTDYSQSSDVEGLIVPAASTFFEWSRVNTTPRVYCVQSLLSAIPEIRRLE